MTTRKIAVMRSSSVRTHAGGGGSACSGLDDALVSLETLVVEVLGLLRGGGDRDIASGLGLRMRGRIGAEV